MDFLSTIRILASHLQPENPIQVVKRPITCETDGKNNKNLVFIFLLPQILIGCSISDSGSSDPKKGNPYLKAGYHLEYERYSFQETHDIPAGLHLSTLSESSYINIWIDTNKTEGDSVKYLYKVRERKINLIDTSSRNYTDTDYVLTLSDTSGILDNFQCYGFYFDPKYNNQSNRFYDTLYSDSILPNEKIRIFRSNEPNSANQRIFGDSVGVLYRSTYFSTNTWSWGFWMVLKKRNDESVNIQESIK